MSDERTAAIENLYNAPAGTPSGTPWYGGLTGLLDRPAQMELQAKQLYQQGGEGDIEGMSEQDVEQLGGMTKAQALQQSQADVAETKQRQVDISNALRPNDQSGIVAKTLFGITDVVPAAIVGSLGGPVGTMGAVGVSTGMSATNEAEAQGVDSATATKMGVIQGAINAAGVGLPMSFAGPIAKRMISGALINAAMQEGSQQLTSHVLASNGYQTMANQYAQTDTSSVLADLALGALFGAHGEAGERVPSDAVDAAVSAKDQASYETQAAPGAPTTINALNAHAQAMDLATKQLLNDEPVELGNTLAKGEYIPMPDPANRAQSIEALQEAGYVPSPDMTDEGIASRFGRQLEDVEQARLQYADIPETEGGKVLNTDIARELSPDYLADRTRSAAVHEPASQFIKDTYAEMLKQEPKPWEDNSVMFTAGGTGAGKTTAVNESLAEDKEKAQIVYDTNMNKFDSADKKVQQALDAGKKVSIAYVYRDPMDALINGALPRAERQRGNFGSGRTVPIDEHIKTHAGALDVVRQLAEKYKDDDRVTFKTVDNSYGKGKQRLVSLDALPDSLQNVDRESLMEALRHEYEQGHIGPETYRGFAGEEAEGQRLGSELRESTGARSDEGTRSGPSEAAARSEGEQNREAVAGNANAGNPEARSRTFEEKLAQQIAQEKGDMPITYRDENGNEVTESASQALARGDEEIGTIQRMADAVRAAVSCAMRFGE
jgi:hypothetical protein